MMNRYEELTPAVQVDIDRLVNTLASHRTPNSTATSILENAIGAVSTTGAGQPATDDSYEGWANRETWAANLWLANDEPSYIAALEIARTSRSALDCGEQLTQMVREWAAHDSNVASDIGSVWRIDPKELGEHWIADTEEM